MQYVTGIIGKLVWTLGSLFVNRIVKINSSEMLSFFLIGLSGKNMRDLEIRIRLF